MQIKGDIASGAATVQRLFQAWTTEFEQTKEKRQVQPAAQGPTQSKASETNLVLPSEIKTPVDLGRVSAAVNDLKLWANTINTANVPDIKIASVELGPVLRWLAGMFSPPSENKVTISMRIPLR